MSSEITDEIAKERLNANTSWLFYDGDCSFCVATARRFEPLLARLNFALAPLQSPWASKSLGFASDAPITEMRVLLPNGQTAGGADAILLIARKTMWGWPLVLLSHLPGIKPLLRFLYGQLAARRYCLSGACSIDSKGATAITEKRDSRRLVAQLATRWLPMVVLVTGVFLLHAHAATWVFMWLLAGATLMGFKWATLDKYLSLASHSPPRFRRGLILAYLFLWPGMDPRPFFTAKPDPFDQSARPTILTAILKILAGASLLLLAAQAFTIAPLLRGWLGMIGIVLFLHFGIFDLLAVAFQTRGIPVEPIMRHPLSASTLADFWGRRWNTAFSQLSRDLFLGSLKRRFGASGATFAIFVSSGLLHEFVISVPARGDYGLPTAYFLLQGLGVLAERSRAGQAFGLGKGGGLRARLFAILMAGGPAFFLFHPPFIQRIILPMLDAIGVLTRIL